MLLLNVFVTMVPDLQYGVVNQTAQCVFFSIGPKTSIIKIKQINQLEHQLAIVCNGRPCMGSSTAHMHCLQQNFTKIALCTIDVFRLTYVA